MFPFKICMTCYQNFVCNWQCLSFCYIGSTAETRRSHLPGIPTIYHNSHHLQNGSQEHENSPDPYLLGRLMGSSYANYPSAFSVTTKSASSATGIRQGVYNSSDPNTAFNSNANNEAPIYVPGAYLVSFPFKKLEKYHY